MRIKLNDEGLLRLWGVFNILLFIYSYYTVYHYWWDPGIKGFDSITYIPNFILIWSEDLFKWSFKLFGEPGDYRGNILWGFCVCIIFNLVLIGSGFVIKWVINGFKKVD